ncbi:GTP-binding nuclear protein GSP1/Ran-like isoform X2 [Hyalella azteca]|uniref:GTP-binding nuclear protein n=1 Tax=Hyalella azteca TaxID=294128 RepID=A0A979FNV0_HYAAZ|nr:GTP-binding nuclear protein GSP1/Ran-like isoform X2 [Hyalella azteca]
MEIPLNSVSRPISNSISTVACSESNNVHTEHSDAMVVQKIPSRKEDSSIKIVLLGDGSTGKTSYVARISSEGFHSQYVATQGYETTRVLVSTSQGDMAVTLWDTAGQEKAGPLRDHYYQDAQGAILFFDVTSKVTYKNIPEWHRDITRVCGDIPVVLFANKVDVAERKVKGKAISYHKKHPQQMILVEGSIKDRLNLKLPIEFLLCHITKNSELSLRTSLDSSLYAAFEAIEME